MKEIILGRDILEFS